MSYKKLIEKLSPPCSKCPYKLGIIKTLVNPCPQCKLDNYKFFKMLKNKDKLGKL